MGDSCVIEGSEVLAMLSNSEKFVDLGTPRRVWAVAAIHSDCDRLMTLHDHLAARFAVNDRLVYLGNYLGAGARDNTAVLDELLAFRAALLSKPGMETSDIVYLRGPAEESWQRLLRLQFAPVPAHTLEKYLEAGVEAYLRLYGISLSDTKAIARADSVTITRWTNQLRVTQRLAPGHEPFMNGMRRAAITRPPQSGAQRLLFVPASFDSGRSLEDQADALWFGTNPFHIPERSQPLYSRIVRGLDTARGGVQTEGAAVTLDGGCGRGGPLVCGCFDAFGKLAEIIAVGGQGAVESMPYDKEDRAQTPHIEPRPVSDYWTGQMAASA